VTVVCGPVRTHSASADTIVNPSIIVEVLSPSTEAYDRGVKFAHYRRIPSLREYLLVAQSEPFIEHYARDEGEGWRLTTWASPAESVPLTSVGATLALAEVYAKVNSLEPPAEATTDPPRPKTLG
jgi:Uma2 family endonuclease